MDPSLTPEFVSIHISAVSRHSHSWRGKSQSWKVCLYPPAQPRPAQPSQPSPARPAQPAPIMFIIYSKDPVKNNQNQENRKGLNIHILSFSICISKRTRNVKQNDNEQFQVLFVEPQTFWYGWTKDVLDCGRSGGEKTRAILEVAIISGAAVSGNIYKSHLLSRRHRNTPVHRPVNILGIGNRRQYLNVSLYPYLSVEICSF